MRRYGILAYLCALFTIIENVNEKPLKWIDIVIQFRSTYILFYGLTDKPKKVFTPKK